MHLERWRSGAGFRAGAGAGSGAVAAIQCAVGMEVGAGSGSVSPPSPTLGFFKSWTFWLRYLTFQSEGGMSRYLNQMFAKHDGEVIALDTWYWDTAEEPNPRLECMHQPQLFTRAHRDEEEAAGRLKSSEYFDWKGQLRCDEFLTLMEKYPNSVYRPDDSGKGENVIYRTRHFYYSLPSLVYELCGKVSLLNIYSHFCSERLLFTKRNHSRPGAPAVRRRREKREASRNGWRDF